MLPPLSNARRGFTLIELLIAVVITGILSSVIFQMINSQSRYATMQTARTEMMQNSRGLLELMSSELRGITLNQGLLYAGPDSIRFRLPLAWGVLCDSTASPVVAVFDNAVWDNATAQYSTVMQTPGSFGVGLAPWALAAGTPAPAVQITSPAANPSRQPAAATACAAYAPPTSGVTLMQFTGVAAPGTGALRQLFVFANVGYGRGPTPAANADRWVRRSFAGGNPEPVAGPISDLAFRYLDANGAAISTPSTGLTATALATVRGIRIVTTMRPRYTTNYGRGTGTAAQAVQQVDSVTIFPRN
jgi:prepilin-type N-terminal cleavage/methylation domain-containing protein